MNLAPRAELVPTTKEKIVLNKEEKIVPGTRNNIVLGAKDEVVPGIESREDHTCRQGQGLYNLPPRKRL